jgi:hypothetical protein
MPFRFFIPLSSEHRNNPGTQVVITRNIEFLPRQSTTFLLHFFVMTSAREHAMARFFADALGLPIVKKKTTVSVPDLKRQINDKNDLP